jgi:hypothetical protein
MFFIIYYYIGIPLLSFYLSMFYLFLKLSTSTGEELQTMSTNLLAANEELRRDLDSTGAKLELAHENY